MMTFRKLYMLAQVKPVQRRADRYPARAWLIGVFTALTILCAGALLAMYFFWIHLHASDIGAVEETGVVTYQHDLIREVLVEYESRAAEFESIRAGSGIRSFLPQQETQQSPSVSIDGPLGAE